MIWEEGSEIDLFSLYVLPSHFWQRDATRGNSFFQMVSYARANVRITNEKQKENSHEGITWSENKINNVQAKEVYSLLASFYWLCWIDIPWWWTLSFFKI